MADSKGNRLEVGDKVRIVQMDDPIYRWLVGLEGTVTHLDEEDDVVRESQLHLELDVPQGGVPGLSTHQAWVEKVMDER